MFLKIGFGSVVKIAGLLFELVQNAVWIERSILELCAETQDRPELASGNEFLTKIKITQFRSFRCQRTFFS